MTFTLAEFLTGGIIASVTVGFFVFLKERKARREEVEAVSTEWNKSFDELIDSQINTLKLQRKRFDEGLLAAEERACHFRKGLQAIAKRKYLQIGQMKAPGATFSPPWEIAEEYLKGESE